MNITITIIYYPVASASYISTHFILTPPWSGRYHYYPHLTDQETEAQRHYTICPLSLSLPIFKRERTQETAVRMKAICKRQRIVRMCIVAARKQPLPQAPATWVHVAFANSWASTWVPPFPHEMNVALLLAGL